MIFNLTETEFEKTFKEKLKLLLNKGISLEEMYQMAEEDMNVFNKDKILTEKKVVLDLNYIETNIEIFRNGEKFEGFVNLYGAGPGGRWDVNIITNNLKSKKCKELISSYEDMGIDFYFDEIEDVDNEDIDEIKKHYTKECEDLYYTES